MKESREPRKKNSNAGPSVPRVELGELEKLLDFMATHELEEFEYEYAGFRIRLKKASASPSELSALRAAAPQISASHQPVVPGSAAHATEPVSASSSAAPAEDLHVIKSPIV